MKKLIIFSLAASCLGACAGAPAPNLINGNYYLAGDPNCVTATPADNGTHVVCYNAKGQATDYREAMTPAQVQAYSYQQAQAAQAAAMLANSNAQLQAQTQALQAQTQGWQAPAVGPYGQQSTTVRCLKNGIYTYCKAQ